MSMRCVKRAVAALVLLGAAGAIARAEDWSNSGGNSARNGLTSEVGPAAPTPLWTAPRSSIIAWQPVVTDGRVFIVRQTGFPPSGEPNGSPVFAYDVDTGVQLWRADVPFNTGDWTTWIAGARDGKVYAARSGNGASVSARLYALDAATGAVVWISAETIDAGAYDGVVFAPNGDLIVASFRTIKRIRATDGATVYSTPRLCSVSGNCGAALATGSNAIYVVDAVPGGNAVRRFDLTTGAFRYAGPLMQGFTIQNTPMVGTNGDIYVSRTQNNAAVDYFYSFADNGTAITQRWRTAAGWSTGSEFAVGPDGSVYMFGTGNTIRRLRQDNGAELASVTLPPNDFWSPRMAADSDGKFFVSNGGFSGGRFFAFDADLSARWNISTPSVNIGAPAIGRRGTLVIAGLDAIRAYRTEPTACVADVDDGSGTGASDGAVGLEDLLYYLAEYERGAAGADVDNGSGTGVMDGAVTVDDLLYFLVRYDLGC